MAVMASGKVAAMLERTEHLRTRMDAHLTARADAETSRPGGRYSGMFKRGAEAAEKGNPRSEYEPMANRPEHKGKGPADAWLNGYDSKKPK